jgi:hypothetical protein
MEWVEARRKGSVLSTEGERPWEGRELGGRDIGDQSDVGERKSEKRREEERRGVVVEG